MLDEVLLIPVVGEDHGLSFGIPAKHHVGVEHAAELSEERRRAVFELFGGDVHHQDEVPIGKLLWHVVGAVQAIPFTFCIVAALVAVTISIVVFAVLVIKWTGTKNLD